MDGQVNQGEKFVEDFLAQLANLAPKIIGAFLIIIIGYVVASLVAGLTRRLLNKANLKDRLHTGQGGNVIQRAVPDPSRLISKVIFWSIFLGGITLGLGAIGIPLITDLIRGIYAYLPNVFAALLIFLVASAISAGVATMVGNVMGDTPTGKIIATGAPILVMGIAIFMILNQLRIAPEIVIITYAALMGSVALGSAIAFGLGGRESAARLLDEAYRKGQSNKQQVKSDVLRGTSRASRMARKLR